MSKQPTLTDEEVAKYCKNAEREGKYSKYEFRAQCPDCTKSQYVYSQYQNEDKGNHEYYTDVFLRCQCGGLVHFILPVN